MRLDANKGDTGWLVLHLGCCEWLPSVHWLDTDTCPPLYGEIDVPATRSTLELVERVRVARKIRVFPAIKVAVIFPPAETLAAWRCAA